MSNENNEVKLYVATPMYGGMATGYFTESMMQLTNACLDNKITMNFAYSINESLIQRARNTLANVFVSTDYTHLMFIDSDIRFNPMDVMSMIHADVDIICGIYPKKEINWYSIQEAVKDGVPYNELGRNSASMVVNLVDYKHEQVVKSDELLEIQAGGTGFMLIKRGVFEEMRKTAGRYLKVGAPFGSEEESDFHYEYFACSIQDKTNIYLSEDYHFCEVARKLGYKIWAAPWIRLSHMGSYLFEGYFASVK